MNRHHSKSVISPTTSDAKALRAPETVTDVLRDAINDAAAEGVENMVEAIDHAGTITRNLAGKASGVARSSLSASVLVLNKHYQAIRVVNVRRAFVMLCKELAEVVHIETRPDGTVGNWQNLNFESWQELSELHAEFEPDGFDWVTTVRFPIAVPRIIRLLGYDRLPRQEVKFNRRNIFARDNNNCQYCGRKFNTSELSLDHVIPRSQDGPTTWDNIVTCCIACNVKKGGRTPEQANMKLLSKPVRPKRSPTVNMRLGDKRYASWKQFLDEAYWTVELK